jgi:hypothetical protein
MVLGLVMFCPKKGQHFKGGNCDQAKRGPLSDAL